MIRTLVVADSGAVMASITATLQHLGAVDIVGYASGRARIDAVVRSSAPDVVIVDQMRWSGIALTRIAEIRAAHAAAVIVGLSDRADADWVIDGLRAGAAAVVPRDLDHTTLGVVLHDVLHPSIERSAA